MSDVSGGEGRGACAKSSDLSDLLSIFFYIHYIQKYQMSQDDKCKSPKDIATRFECMGLSWAGCLSEKNPFSWTSLSKNDRLAYMIVDISIVILLLVLLAILFRKREAPMYKRI